jgi:hypothetical protein
MQSGKMHQTTVRFGTDLWEALERECSRLGLSVAQYVREAALARLVYAAGRRGDDEFELALELAVGDRPQPSGRESEVESTEHEGDDDALMQSGEAELPLDRARLEIEESAALWAEGRQARRRAQELRGEIRSRRAEQARRTRPRPD